jgi:hypothetical protein
LAAFYYFVMSPTVESILLSSNNAAGHQEAFVTSDKLGKLYVGEIDTRFSDEFTTAEGKYMAE